MKLTITAELDSYDDAKYVLGAAALVQAATKLALEIEIETKELPIPVAVVLERSASFANQFLIQALHGQYSAHDLFGADDENSIDVWIQAFRALERSKTYFLKLIDTDDLFKERYRQVVDDNDPLDNAT